VWDDSRTRLIELLNPAFGMKLLLYYVDVKKLLAIKAWKERIPRQFMDVEKVEKLTEPLVPPKVADLRQNNESLRRSLEAIIAKPEPGGELAWRGRYDSLGRRMSLPRKWRRQPRGAGGSFGARPRSYRPGTPQPGSSLQGVLSVSYVYRATKWSCPVHKSDARHRTGAMRTSENAVKAKFEKFLLSEVGISLSRGPRGAGLA
jgi:hypothetical protein